MPDGSVPDFVVAGHVTLDDYDGLRLIGGAAYSALTAARLGRRVGLLTSYAGDLDPQRALDGIDIKCLPSPKSTVFRNHYAGERRQQQLLSQALPLDVGQIPLSWLASPVVHLTPMCGELGPEFLGAFPRALVGASPQGWMRSVGPHGQVRTVSWRSAHAALARLDVVVLSLEDLGGKKEKAAEWASRVKCLILTCGESGAWVFHQGVKSHVPALSIGATVDPTGAGDAFAASFLVKMAEGFEPLKAALFASVVAAFVVRGTGLDGIPRADHVNEVWQDLCSEGRLNG